VCRFWTARAVFDQPDWTRRYQQYTDTPGGTYWCTALADAGDLNRSRWPSKPRTTTADTIVILSRYTTSYMIPEKRVLGRW
jgi:hypothetical protein